MRSAFPRNSPAPVASGSFATCSPMIWSGFSSRAYRRRLPNFQVRQIVPHDGIRFVIQFVAPLEGNREAIGLDVSSEPVREACCNGIRCAGPRHAHRAHPPRSGHAKARTVS